jgi:hypothetical protein
MTTKEMNIKLELCKQNKLKIMKTLKRMIRVELSCAKSCCRGNDAFCDLNTLIAYTNNAAQITEILAHVDVDNFKSAIKKAALIENGWLEFELPEELT